ncbi:uncharacterized protein [Blastocystis hominis]|uniref:COMM domain-containing protein n=1 Tax=Blastocystis hominis TaxID=12968 RepID=D8LZN8_BLAHO|nr:uncharacterized protein [Blastocystis hominis]CBK21277.2 unnamed protein product [Blastocystis hominis]|eukprot:XP_012895325.1 uncharacterized protein [Blastocystis hominis]
MNSAGEVYNEALNVQCIQALKFLNIFASKVHIRKEDVIGLLFDFGLPADIISDVVDKVITLAKEYREILDSFIQSISSMRLLDFNWSLRLIVCDGNSLRHQLTVIRISLKLEDKQHSSSTVVFELTQPQLQRLLEIFDSIDNTLGLLNVNL